MDSNQNYLAKFLHYLYPVKYPVIYVKVWHAKEVVRLSVKKWFEIQEQLKPKAASLARYILLVYL